MIVWIRRRLLPLGVAAAILFGGGPSSAGEAPPDEITPRVYRRLSALRPGIRFEEVCRPDRETRKTVCGYAARLEDGSRVSLEEPSGFKPLFQPFRTRTEVLEFVRFLSDPPTPLGGRAVPSSAVPYYELGAAIGPPGEAPFFSIAQETLDANWIEPPRVAVIRLGEGRWRFAVTRYALLHEEIPAIVGGKPPRRIGRVLETVDPEGNYRNEIEVIPVDADFVVKVFPRS